MRFAISFQNPACKVPALALLASLALAPLAVPLASPAMAASSCQSGSFETWLEGVKQEAASKGVSQQAINASLAGVTFDPSVVSHDRGQKVFRQSFEQFAGRMVPTAEVNIGNSRPRVQAAMSAAFCPLNAACELSTSIA